MRCPFLQEAHVKSCQASEFKKMIVRTSSPADEKCSSAAYAGCPAAKQRRVDAPPQDHCPYLNHFLVQYCSAAPVAQYIPYSESILSRCGNDGHRYCELYLSLAHPEELSRASSESRGPEDTFAEGPRGLSPMLQVDDITVPSDLLYSPNHMWLRVDDDGWCHVGIDGFLAKVLGQVEKLNFLPAKGADRPAAVLTCRGADLQVRFPNPMILAASNTYLRLHPERVTAHPYTLGWLFEGRDPATAGHGPAHSISAGLIAADQAARWMLDELRRISEFMRDQVMLSKPQAPMNAVSGDALQHLSREEELHLFHEFFSPYASWREQC